MKLHIQNGSSIGNIQKEFNSIYPYLKIEFFKPSTDAMGKNGFSANKTTIDQPVSQHQIISKSVIIDVANERTVTELDHEFREALCLSVRLFRKSENMWVQTTLTKNWSLRKQNEEGEFMSAPVLPGDVLDTNSGDKWMEPE